MSWFTYTTKRLVQVLEKFCESHEGADATVQLLLPAGRPPDQREFNIREVKLVENKIIGSKEKYKVMILVE